eukprot:COSAG01_NODE_23672_length_806_cov_0.905233_1_plen_214_part_10
MTYRQIIVATTADRKQLYEKVLGTVKMLENVPVAHLGALADNLGANTTVVAAAIRMHAYLGRCLPSHSPPEWACVVVEPVYYSEGQAVMTQGEAGDYFYLVVEGSVSVVVDGAELAKRSSGDYIGEQRIADSAAPLPPRLHPTHLDPRTLPQPALYFWCCAGLPKMYSSRRGDLAGEAALLNDAPRNATVVAMGSVELARLHREEFQALVPSP